MTSSEAIPMRTSSWWPSPRSEATTTCFGRSPGLRPSVMAMSMSGTMMPRKLKMPTRYAGASGSLVSSGQSKTSSTSSTGKQKRSRPLRKTQYCDSGARSSSGPRASSRSAASASAASGVRWNSSFIASLLWHHASCKPAHGAKQFLARKRLGHVTVRALLRSPVTIALGVFRRHENYGDGVELRAALQFAANLKAVAFRHHHVEQDYAGAFRGDGLLDTLGIVEANGRVAFRFEEPLNQLHLRRRIVNDQNLLQHGRLLPIVLRRAEVHVSGQEQGAGWCGVWLIYASKNEQLAG